MLYNAPKDENGKSYWVPVVIKNRDYLMGYIKGVGVVEDLLKESLESMGVHIDFNVVDMFLDSSRFNDVLEDGRRESEISDDDKREFLINVIKDKLDRTTTKHVENDVGYTDPLSVECTCGLGFYSWKWNSIPDETFKCGICGKILIDYTNHNDFEYEFDGGDEEIENDKEES